eukprot:scpid90737/ scgid27184/ 
MRVHLACCVDIKAAWLLTMAPGHDCIFPRLFVGKKALCSRCTTMEDRVCVVAIRQSEYRPQLAVTAQLSASHRQQTASRNQSVMKTPSTFTDDLGFNRGQDFDPGYPVQYNNNAQQCERSDLLRAEL